MTQLEAAKRSYNKEMEMVSRDEQIDINTLLSYIAEGKIVIPKNKNHDFQRLWGLEKDCGQR